MNIYITNHAIERYRQRFGNHTANEARRLLWQAYNESEKASQSIRRKVRQLGPLREGSEYRYHSPTNLFLVVDPRPNGSFAIVTCFVVV